MKTIVSGEIPSGSGGTELMAFRLAFSGIIAFCLNIEICIADEKDFGRALDTFDSALNIHILYYYMVSNYMNIFALFKPTWCVFRDFG